MFCYHPERSSQTKSQHHMYHRSKNIPNPHLRSSSTSISAMEGSFSLAEFGAWDMNMSTEDFEAMAEEAENVARARIGKMATMNSMIDSMCESEDDDAEGNKTEQRREMRCGDQNQDENSTFPCDASWDPQSHTSSVRSEVQDCGPEHEGNECEYTGDESDHSMGNPFTKDDNDSQQESFSSLDDPWDIAVATAPFSIPKAEEARVLANSFSTIKYQHDERRPSREYPTSTDCSKIGKEKNVVCDIPMSETSGVNTVDTVDSSEQNISERVSQGPLGKTSSGSTSLERSHNSSDKSPVTPASPFDLRDLLDSLWTDPVLSTKSRSSSIEKVGRRASAHPVHTASPANNDPKPTRRSSHRPHLNQQLNATNGSKTSNTSKNVVNESNKVELSPKSPLSVGKESSHGAVAVEKKCLHKSFLRRGNSNFDNDDSQLDTQQRPPTAQSNGVSKSASEIDSRDLLRQNQSGNNLNYSPSSNRDSTNASRNATNEIGPNLEAKQSPRAQKECPPTNHDRNQQSHARKSRSREKPLSKSYKGPCRDEPKFTTINEKAKATTGSTYNIGDNLRSKSDIIHEESPKEALKNISKLQVFDYAFVRRSKSDQWTFSIVCKVTEDEIQFVLCKSGATKRLGRPLWVHNIRRPNPERCAIRQRYPETSKPNETHSIRDKKCGLRSSLPNREFLRERNHHHDRHHRQNTQSHVRFA